MIYDWWDYKDLSQEENILAQKLQENIQYLQAVSVEDTRPKKAKQITKPDVKITSEQLQGAPPENVLWALQGRAPGVVVTTDYTTGEPLVMIRNSAQNDLVVCSDNAENFGELLSTEEAQSIEFGQNSVAPLYLVDDIMVDVSVIATIDVNDVASIEIFKSGASTAMYGTRGMNGVVAIYTKTGQTLNEKTPIRKREVQDIIMQGYAQTPEFFTQGMTGKIHKNKNTSILF